jgi:uncharacterized membrane protein YhhN
MFLNKIKVFFLVFVLVSIIDIIGIIFKIPMVIFVFKPLILSSLLVLYLLSVVLWNKMYILALIFSFLGDIFLLFSGELFFILGLISFLIAHILFIKIVVGSIQKTSILKIIVSTIPFLILFILFLFILKDSFGELLIPVIIYGITISIFGITSLIYYSEEKSTGALLMLFGALVFIISDSVLAINKFYLPTLYFEITIMLTYVLSQYFIYKSMILKEY